MAGSKVEQPGSRAVQAERAGWRHCGNSDRRRRRLVGATGIALSLISCSNSGESADKYKIGALERRIESLELSDDLQRENIASLRIHQSTELTPDDQGFGYVSNGAISATIALKGIEAAGSASTAKLEIGNLTDATLRRCWLVLEVRSTKDGPFADGKVREISGELRPGAFNKVSIVIPDVKPEGISALRASSIMCEGISLRR